MTSNVIPGTSVPKLELVRRNPETAAKISKAIQNQLKFGFDVKKQETYYNLNQSKIQEISNIQKDRLKENDNIMDLFPDIAMAESIVVSSITSPKDLTNENLIYQTVTTLLPSALQTKINAVIKENIEGNYNLLLDLPKIIGDALFRTGSYVSLVIPEAAVDEIINGRNYATESDRSYINELIDNKGRAVPLNILGPAETPKNSFAALESFFNSEIPARNDHSNFVKLKTDKKLKLRDPSNAKDSKNRPKFNEEDIFEPNATTEHFLEITDNYQLIKLPKLIDVISKQRLERAVKGPRYSKVQRFSLESFSDATLQPKKLTDQEFHDLVYKNNPPMSQQFMIMPGSDNLKRHSIGRPLRMKIPSEAVVPVYPPGEPENHRGYFVLVDTDGNWVTRSSMDTSTAGLQALISNQGVANNLTSLMLDKSRRSMSDNQQDLVVDQMLSIYSSIVEADMLARLKNGIYGTQLDVGLDREWERIMLARALAGKMTRLIYIPKEFISYYAYDYHENGIGKSYLDKVKMLTSLRAILLFGKTMAELKGAINVTKVDLTIDKDDPDPQKTIEMATHDVLKMREAYFPLGVNSPVDLLQWISRAGMMFTFKGHPGLPETSFEFSNGNMQHSIPDSKIDEDLRKQTFMTFGLTPEQVDNAFGPEFATTAIQQNLLFAKRIKLLSDTTARHVTNDVRNIVRHDAIIRKDILKILKESKDDVIKLLTPEEQDQYREKPDVFLYHFLDRVVDNIWMDLPKPDVGATNEKSKAFKDRLEVVDNVLNSYFSTEVFGNSIDGEISSHMDELRGIWKHFLMRQWVADEGFLPEIGEIFKLDENGNPANDILEVLKKYKESALLSAVKYFQQSKDSKDAVNTDLQQLNVDEGQSNPLNTSSNTDIGSDDNLGGLNLDSTLDTGDLTDLTETTETTEETTTEEQNTQEGQSTENTGEEGQNPDTFGGRDFS